MSGNKGRELMVSTDGGMLVQVSGQSGSPFSAPNPSRGTARERLRKVQNLGLVSPGSLRGAELTWPQDNRLAPLIRSLNWAKENVDKDNGAPQNPEIFKATIKASSAGACLFNIAHLGGTSLRNPDRPLLKLILQTPLHLLRLFGWICLTAKLRLPHWHL
jgi:hypothetical protein